MNGSTVETSYSQSYSQLKSAYSLLRVDNDKPRSGRAKPPSPLSRALSPGNRQLGLSRAVIQTQPVSPSNSIRVMSRYAYSILYLKDGSPPPKDPVLPPLSPPRLSASIIASGPFFHRSKHTLSHSDFAHPHAHLTSRPPSLLAC